MWLVGYASVCVCTVCVRFFLGGAGWLIRDISTLMTLILTSPPAFCSVTRPLNSQSYKEQYTTYGWHCGYVHFDGSVAKRKSALGHWHHKVEVTSQGRRVLVPQTSLALRPGGASPAHKPSLPAEINNQFLEDHHYTTPR